MKVILASFLIFGLASAADKYNCDCGWRNAGRIGGGTETRKNEYPWQAGIGEKGYSTVYCAGTLITKWHIITAAGCVHKREAKDLYLTVGNFYTADDKYTQKRDVAKIVIHRKFNPRRNINNIAIVMAKKEFIYTRFVGPACMPAAYLGDMINSIVKVTGWGSSTMSKSNYDEMKYRPLKEADVVVVEHDRCNNGYKMCIEGEGTTFGRGDGGNPIVMLDDNRFTLVGIFITQIERKNNPDRKVGLGTSVSPYIYWINEQISNMKRGATTCHKILK